MLALIRSLTPALVSLVAAFLGSTLPSRSFPGTICRSLLRQLVAWGCLDWVPGFWFRSVFYVPYAAVRSVVDLASEARKEHAQIRKKAKHRPLQAWEVRALSRHHGSDCGAVLRVGSSRSQAARQGGTLHAIHPRHCLPVVHEGVPQLGAFTLPSFALALM